MKLVYSGILILLSAFIYIPSTYRFEYSFFHGKLTNISGDTPGIKVSIY